eukprot:TRINITY_DN18027_c0_g1_i1.p1 TRINITY_DN18027_c0_g1~~TRINITY_DN18027_c0_g1_i1.p1  ORF type:complete len:218 (+),score=36.04 TRINITY_DN18027_c0_g1_i1:66-719(+)
MEASKSLPFVLDLNKDFRVRNTFIEWMPTSQLESKAMKKYPSWDGPFLPASSPRKDLSDLSGSEVSESAKYLVADNAREPLPAGALKHLPDGALFCRQDVHQNSSITTRSKQSPTERQMIPAAMSKTHLQSHRRPSKKTRLLCSEIMKYLIESYSHDKLTMCAIASQLAWQSSYMKGLCLKHEIPLAWQAGQNNILHEMPWEIRNAWAQVLARHWEW